MDTGRSTEVDSFAFAADLFDRAADYELVEENDFELVAGDVDDENEDTIRQEIPDLFRVR